MNRLAVDSNQGVPLNADSGENMRILRTHHAAVVEACTDDLHSAAADGRSRRRRAISRIAAAAHRMNAALPYTAIPTLLFFRLQYAHRLAG